MPCCCAPVRQRRRGGHSPARGRAVIIQEIKVLPDVEIYFPRQDETLATGRRAKRHVGELVLNGKCLRVRVGDDSSVPQPVLLLWPSAFELNVDDGVAEIIDASRRVVARVGDEAEHELRRAEHEPCCRTRGG
jgi:hypothetical protein